MLQISVNSLLIWAWFRECLLSSVGSISLHFKCNNHQCLKPLFLWDAVQIHTCCLSYYPIMECYVSEPWLHHLFVFTIRQIPAIALFRMRRMSLWKQKGQLLVISTMTSLSCPLPNTTMIGYSGRMQWELLFPSVWKINWKPFESSEKWGQLHLWHFICGLRTFKQGIQRLEEKVHMWERERSPMVSFRNIHNQLC